MTVGQFEHTARWNAAYFMQVDLMESEISELNTKRQYRIEREIQDLDRKLSFLKKRFDEAEEISWKGTLKKNPLWWLQ